MPEKKQGVLGIIKNVFKAKKCFNEDIVHQAESVITQYISTRKNEIIGTYTQKNKLLSLMLWGLGIVSAVCVYNIIF